MKAVVWTKYGPPEVLQFKEVDKPTPKDDEVLIKMAAANVFPGDCEMRRFQIHPLFWLPLRLFLGIRKPRIKILGQELAGEVVAVGKAVTQYKQGDQVFSPTEFGGAYAEYVRTKSKLTTLKPANMSYEEAAAVSVGGLNALHFVRKGKIQRGQKVLIFGAAGCIGTMAVQIAKAFGAEVTAVDSTLKLDMLSSIGADHVIDYTQEDFTQNGESYDVIIDVVGKSSYSRSLKSLKHDGYFVLGNAPTSHMLRSLWPSSIRGKHVRVAITAYRTEDLVFLKELIEQGKLKTVIDRIYPLQQTVEAHRYVESGQKAGNVILTMADSGSQT